LDWEDSPCDQEVDAPRYLSTSTLHDRRRRHLGHLQPHLQGQQQPTPPSLGHRHRDTTDHSSDEPQSRKGHQVRFDAPPKQPERRRGVLPTKSNPTTPPPPQRRRQPHHYTLRYIHDVIRRFPILPPPERPPEGEGSTGSTPARWEERRLSQIASIYCRWGTRSGPTRVCFMHVLVTYTTKSFSSFMVFNYNPHF
jgi:hypothetical protein